MIARCGDGLAVAVTAERAGIYRHTVCGAGRLRRLGGIAVLTAIFPLSIKGKGLGISVGSARYLSACGITPAAAVGLGVPALEGRALTGKAVLCDIIFVFPQHPVKAEIFAVALSLTAVGVIGDHRLPRRNELDDGYSVGIVYICRADTSEHRPLGAVMVARGIVCSARGRYGQVLAVALPCVEGLAVRSYKTVGVALAVGSCAVTDAARAIFNGNVTVPIWHTVSVHGSGVGVLALPLGIVRYVFQLLGRAVGKLTAVCVEHNGKAPYSVELNVSVCIVNVKVGVARTAARLCIIALCPQYKSPLVTVSALGLKAVLSSYISSEMGKVKRLTGKLCQGNACTLTLGAAVKGHGIAFFCKNACRNTADKQYCG